MEELHEVGTAYIPGGRGGALRHGPDRDRVDGAGGRRGGRPADGRHGGVDGPGVAMDPRGNVLAYHLAYVAAKRVQQLIIVATHSSSPNAAKRNTINRANCLGHWNNFLAFKERGVRYFDFGGWYPGTTDIRSLGMNAFKKGFGGQVVREYEGEQIQTLKGWVVLRAARILERARSPRIGLTPKSEHTAHATTTDHEVSPAF